MLNINKNFTKEFLGPIEKKFRKFNFKSCSKENHYQVDLKILPKYICYRSALLKEKATLKFIIAILTILLFGQYIASKIESSALQERLRLKEYILAPGVIDFTTAAPQSIPDKYVSSAVEDFMSTVGNFNSTNINDQYDSIMKYMSPSLKIRFQEETKEWIDQVKSQSISQLLTIQKKEITNSKEGKFKVILNAKAEF